MRHERASIVVIGAGPAGSTAATLLKQYRPDARIILVERELFPRPHIGESTLPDANPVLKKLGVLQKIDDAGFIRKAGITYKWRNDRPIFSEEFAKGVMKDGVVDHSWQIDRSRYDSILLEHAREAGVEVWQPCSVRRVVRDGERVTGVVVEQENGESCTISSEYVIDASGQARLLGRLLGLEKSDHELGDLAIYRYYRGVTWPEEIIGSPEASKIFFAATPAGWVWYIPIEVDLASVGVVTRREFVRDRGVDELFEEQIAFVPELTAPMANAHVEPAPGLQTPFSPDQPPEAHTETTKNWSYEHSSVSGPGWYLVGDAASFVDPILSSGILLAHRAGLAAANAIMTEWENPEIAVDSLHAAYKQFYEDICRGFIEMARWWYNQRETGIEDWWKTAGILARSVRAGFELDDLRAFMHFAAGYNSDFRFANIGAGFGVEGLAVCVEGLTDQSGASDPLAGHIADRRRAVTRKYDSVTLEWYLATYVETHRWWRLPAFRFVRDGKEITYRPTAVLDDKSAPDTPALIRMMKSVLDSIDDQRCINDVVKNALRRLDDDHSQALRGGIGRIVADMISIDLLSANGPVSRIGQCATLPANHRDAYKRAFHRAHVTSRVPADITAGPNEALPEIVLSFDGEEVKYCPPFAMRTGVHVDGLTSARATMAVIQACDGSRTIESVTQLASRRLEMDDFQLATDLVSQIIADLVSMEALVLTAARAPR